MLEMALPTEAFMGLIVKGMRRPNTNQNIHC